MRNLTIQNLTLKNCNLNESPCGENVVFKNIQLEEQSRVNICSKIIDDPVSVRKMELNNKNISINTKLSGSVLKIVISPDAGASNSLILKKKWLFVAMWLD